MNELLAERFETMPPRLQAAARFVLDNPKDVALLSMREQAQLAGVSHSTMMRLARWIGLEGYDDMRSLYAKALRDVDATAERDRFAPDAPADEGYSEVGPVTDTLAAQVARLGDYGNAAQIYAAAESLAGARHLFSLGLRRELPVAQHFSSMLSALTDRVSLLDAAGGMGIDALRGAGKGDAMLVVGMAPYARATIEIAQHAARRGVAVVAITDSNVSPLARLARHSIVVTLHSRSFFQSITPALAAAEALVALIAPRLDTRVEEALKDEEEQLADLDVYWTPSR
ncbi:MurR/RpiR family transcriptional regulator [Nitratireductor sp. ZSWI3]|uniref:MurR/RpiR family transcriptional regulator n=1 Tax=Nitratireductor sp. ZSWI3 TaxID=2966359 RepID=UPI00214FE13E|nr:MurR/RpiR family transcriptional regulator [Nitratireductor sp. ZSWI3]MCR4264819.1 MurR/RpiR family transcriptional regulator [Nitratireductor sp. ZSWI3]